MQQAGLFLDIAASTTRALPVVGEQKDIRYFARTARSILNSPDATGMDFWSINPYIGCAFGCTYCYARYAHRYTMERTGEVSDTMPDDAEPLPPWLAFERRIFVKRNAPDVLRHALLARGARVRPVLAGEETIVIGTATDPYQPAERLFRVTRGVLEVLAEHPGLSITIITKSPLITRDIDLLSRIAAHSRFSVHLSLITLDRELARRIEPRAPTPESRLRALARLSAAGIAVGINVMPVLPGITDAPDDLTALVRRVKEAGAASVNACALRLQSTARATYLPFIAQEFPQLAARYQTAYGRGDQVGERYRDGLHRFLTRVCRDAGIRFGRHGREDPENAGSSGGDDDAENTLPPPLLTSQLDLGV